MAGGRGSGHSDPGCSGARLAHRTGSRASLDRWRLPRLRSGRGHIAPHLAPLGDGSESYAKVFDLLLAGRHLRSFGTPSNRLAPTSLQLAMLAARHDGYECGWGSATTNVPS